MNFTNFALKLNSLFTTGTALYQSSFVGADGDLVDTIEITSLGSDFMTLIVATISSFILKFIYTICSFVLNVIEFLQFVISSILGINANLDNYVVLDSKNPLVRMMTNESVMRVFKVILGVSIVLVIIFTIFAIVKSEYNNALKEDNEANSKGRIFVRTLKSLFTMGMFPLLILVAVILVNAVLAGFNSILSGGKNTTLAGQVFVTSAYSANNYRNYANADMRIPIVINFSDPIMLGQGNAYSAEELSKFYKDFQPLGKSLYDQYADNNFQSFSDCVVYKNNQLYNTNEYNSQFEKFVCTREQYYVLADFMDYAVKNNLKYYVKNMKDVDIDWKYVSDSVFNRESGTLTITYKNSSNYNNGKNYTVVYAPTSDEISTPISDALKTISTLLAIGDYSDYAFDVLKRAEDSINVVEWNTDKVYLRLSSGYKSNPTNIDKLLLFERARLKYNNTLNYTIEELENGVELPLEKIKKRFYQQSTGTYITTAEYYVVTINGTHYQVEENVNLKYNGEFLTDEFNDPYYTIISSNFGLKKSPYPLDDNYDIDIGSGLGYYRKNSDSFKDIIITKLNGVFQNENDTLFAEYDDTIANVIKDVSWPQKLINDLQVIYKDININQMISTNKWLTQLGEYVNAGDMSGEFTSNISTALIHPLGLILSELFLGEIDVSDSFNLYGSLMFNSAYDEETIKALMLSTLGEKNYYQIKYQLEYFCEIFNVFMGPVLDEIAYYENFELRDSEQQTVQLYTYKAYLASMLISSSSADWFYKTALALLGSSNLGNEITNSDGFYKKYSELTESKKSLFKSLYEQNIETLAEQFVNEEDESYPEYMIALKNYMGLDGSTDFDDRLECVLKSILSKDKQQLVVTQKYNDLVGRYNGLNGYLTNSFGTEIKENILSFITIPNQNGDAFTSATDITVVNGLKDKKTKEMERLNIYLGSINQSNNTTLKNLLNNYYDSINNYADAKIEYLEEDKSFYYTNKGKELKEELTDALKQIPIANKSANWYGINKITVQNASSLETAAFKYNNRIYKMSNYTDWVEFKQVLKDVKNAVQNKASEMTSSNYEKISLFLGSIQNYIDLQDKLDKLNRYYIVYGINAIQTQNASTSLTVVVNNKHYTVGQNFTKAKFIEYVLGAKYLNDNGYETVFVDPEYEGFFVNKTAYINQQNRVDFDLSKGSFSYINDFLVELGDITAVLYQMTNFVNLTDMAYDELIIGSTSSQNLSEFILKMLVEGDYIPNDLLCAFLGINKNDSNVKASAISKINSSSISMRNSYLNTILGYLLLTDTDSESKYYRDYTKLTLKELRNDCLAFLVDYETQKGESVEQNQKRYLAVLALACSDWYTEQTNGVIIGAIDNNWRGDRSGYIKGLRVDKQSQATILRLAGLDNRPYEELVTAEYSIDFNEKLVDEANGDIFIICTFDEDTRLYVPFMMSNKENASLSGLKKDESGKNWVTKYGYEQSFTLSYYNSGTQFYPVIAKGIVTEDGMPTAIREKDGYIEYYRNDIIIHDVSNIGLEEYFVSADQIPVQYTGISYLVNTFSKIFTGQTLVEKMAQTIPRFAAHTDYNFCYGIDSKVEDASLNGYVAINFNFDEKVCLKINNVYKVNDMNIVVLIIGVVTTLMALWKSLWGVVSRMYDVTILFLIGPTVISTINLRSDKRDKDNNIDETSNDSYDRWKQTLIEKLLNVFAYAIGFNIFFIVVPIISSVQLFSSTAMFQKLPLFKHIGVNFLNEVARLVFLVCAAYLSTRAPDIFASITQTANGFKDGEQTLANVKGTMNAVADVVSGQYMLDKVGSAVDNAKNLIPGYAIGKKVAGKVKEVSRKVVAKGAKYIAMAYGVDANTAEQMSKALEKKMNDMAAADEKYKADKKEAREKREKKRNGK